MADSRTRTLRLFVGLALLVAGLAEAQTLLQSLRSELRFRSRVERMLCQRLAEAWPVLLPLLESGEIDEWAGAAQMAQQLSLARESEVFDLPGRPLGAWPRESPVRHSLEDSRRSLVLEGQPQCMTAEAEGELRVMAYAAFPIPNPQRILRLAHEEPDLAEDLAERGLSIVVHQMGLGLLVLAGVIALWPARSGLDNPSRLALGAYERAMEGIREREAVVSDRHAAERDRLAAALREREALSRAGEITAQIVHEVRNGLGTILGYARLLERGEGSVAERARLMREECEGLERTIRRFLELVRDARPNLAPFDIGRTLRRVAEREARPKERAVPEVVCMPDLPLIVGDESLLERAFENLVRNALEAAAPDGHVSVAAAVDGGTLIVTVSDDGPGLGVSGEPPLLTSTKGGLGIGLSLARKIAVLHDGSLSLLDRAPRGAQAVVALPVHGPRRDPQALPLVASAGRAGSSAGRGDDD